MAFSLYSATVPSFRQILKAVSGLVDKAEAFCAEKGLAPETIIQARLAEDMHPFAYQVKSTAVHSVGAFEGVRKGVFSPDTTASPDTFAGLKEKMADADAVLSSLDPEDINRLEGGDMRFEAGSLRLDFTAEDFLMSFSLPNFYFHATTAYDILRMKGVQIGKRDFTGRPRLRG